LAAAAAKRGIDLILISTNEVFNGERQARPYRPLDEPSPANPYGASKLAAERAAADAFASSGSGARLGIVRTAWLFGSGRADFPMKIALAARRAIAAGEPVRIVADEIGTPTYVDDVAEAVANLVAGGAFDGISHLVNDGTASRAEWGRDVLRRLRLGAEVVEVSLADFPRPSRPPRWGVLDPTPLRTASQCDTGERRWLPMLRRFASRSG
jgi:dTDP-4-dehydrorhamnose reductase